MIEEKNSCDVFIVGFASLNPTVLTENVSVSTYLQWTNTMEICWEIIEFVFCNCGRKIHVLVVAL